MIEALPQRSASSIVRFLADEPSADAERIHEWLGELSGRLCPKCNRGMKRFEAFNGGCDPCHRGEVRSRLPDVRQIRKNYGIPDAYANFTFESWKGDLPPAMRGDGTPDPTKLEQWAQNPGGFALMVGTNGAGKTHAATAIMCACLDLGYWCRWHSARFLPTELLSEDPKGDRQVWHNATQCDLLVIDDLGAQRANDVSQDRLAEVIDYRFMHNRPTVVTTNIDGKDLLDREPRIASRLLSGLVFKFVGRDARRHGGVA